MTTDADIERRLAALPVAVQWPQGRDISAGVLAAIRAAEPAADPSGPPQAHHRRRSRRDRAPWWAGGLRPALVAVLLVVALAGGALVASPRAREAVASLLGVAGIDVQLQETIPQAETVPPPAPASFRLGEAVTLQQAQNRVAFPVRRLPLEGDLDRVGGGVYVDGTVPGGIVHILYAEQDGLPVAFPKDVGAMLTQFRAPSDGPLFTKEALRADGALTPTEVDGQFALWVTGPSHVLIPNRDGAPVRSEARLSANALLWTSAEGITYRLESALEMEAAVTLAEQLQ